MTLYNMRKICSFEILLPFFLTAVYCYETKTKYDVIIVDQSKSWKDARWYCQSQYIDLVTEEIKDMNSLYNSVNKTLTYLWLGLQRDSEDYSVWKWVNVRTGEGLLEDEVSEESVLGDNGYFGDCGVLNAMFNQLESKPCSAHYDFFCFYDNLIVVKEEKSWEDALNHCRGMTTPYYRYDLLSGPSSMDHSYVQDKIKRATIDEVWIGLRFLAGEWWWMDGEQVDDGGSLLDCPPWRHCGVLSGSSADIWITRECSEKRSFICHRVNA